MAIACAAAYRIGLSEKISYNIDIMDMYIGYTSAASVIIKIPIFKSPKRLCAIALKVCLLLFRRIFLFNLEKK